MNPRVGVALVCLVGFALLAGPVLATAGDAVLADGENASDAVEQEQDAPFGSQMSGFMQSTSAATNDSVETGMWARGVDANASDAPRQVARRTDRLENRVQRLEAALDDLEGTNVTGAGPATAGEVARLTARVHSLQASINDTGRVAHRVGVDTDRLERLRTNASTLSGHEVARMARNLSLGPPAGVPGGPPDGMLAGPPADNETGPPTDNRTGPPGNEPADSTENRTAGSPDGAGDGSPDQTPDGSPDESTDRRGGSSDGTHGGAEESTTDSRRN